MFTKESGKNTDLLCVFSDVFVRRRFQAQASAELVGSECPEKDRQRQFDPTVTTTKAETRG